MKWLHNFFSRKRRERLCRVRDFVVLAWTGNGLGAAELAFLRQLMARYRFEADLLNVVSQAPDKVADSYPAAAEERALHLVRMVRFALRHGKENDRARAYCRLTARKMGLPQGSSQAAAARLRARPDADDRDSRRDNPQENIIRAKETEVEQSPKKKEEKKEKKEEKKKKKKSFWDWFR